jgi:hypothetical protein
MEWTALVIFWLICGIIGTVIGSFRNAGGTGFLLGFLLGPLGVLLVLMVEGRPKCPHCAEHHQPGAKICPHCRTALTVTRSWVDDWQSQRVDRTRTRMSAQDQAKADAIAEEALGLNPPSDMK